MEQFLNGFVFFFNQNPKNVFITLSVVVGILSIGFYNWTKHMIKFYKIYQFSKNEDFKKTLFFRIKMACAFVIGIYSVSFLLSFNWSNSFDSGKMFAAFVLTETFMFSIGFLMVSLVFSDAKKWVVWTGDNKNKQDLAKYEEHEKDEEKVLLVKKEMENIGSFLKEVNTQKKIKI